MFCSGRGGSQYGCGSLESNEGGTAAYGKRKINGAAESRQE